jgi:N-acetyl-anhydromuramyl-L-alanine amidase AmpD
MLSGLFDTIRRFLAQVPAHGDHGAEPTADPADVTPPNPGFYVDNDGWLRDEAGETSRIARIPSPRSSALLGELNGKPAGILWHWTATRGGTMHTLAKSIAKPVPPNGRAASWHVGIARNGSVYHSVSLKRGSWHAGGSSAARFEKDVYKMVTATQRGVLATRWKISERQSGVGANSLFVGIELENVGQVKNVNGKWQGWPFGHDGQDGPIVPPDQVSNAVLGKRYHAFTDEQVRAAAMVARAIVQWVPGIPREACAWTHYQVDPTRKTDPGPVWVEKHLPAVLDEAFR